MLDIFFNNLPLWKVPGLFSWQHVTLILIATAFVVVFTLIMKKRTQKTQTLVFRVLAVACLVVFCGRFLWGYDSLIYTPAHVRVGFWYQTLVPLELCNLGIFILIIAAFTKKRGWYIASFYVTLIGGITAFICFPYSHTWPTSTILNFQFFDYYFIHTQLVALPIAFVATKHYKPKMSDIYKALLILVGIAVSLYFICLTLNAIYQTDVVNYMWVMGEKKIPLLKDLWAAIGIPLVYMLPLLPFIVMFYIGLTLLVLPKGTRVNEFKNVFVFKLTKTKKDAK